MKTFQHILFAKAATAEDTKGPAAGAPAAKVELKPAIALMSPKALRAIAEARPELKAALAGYNVRCRRLGDGDASIIQLDNAEITDQTVLVGFSIPTNLLVRGKKGIEIPVGRGINRTEMSNRVLDDAKVEALIKALGETSRIALRAYTVQPVPVVESEHKTTEDVPDEEILF